MANRLRRSDSKVGAVCAIQQNAISLPALGSGTAVLQSSLKVSVNLIAICIFVAWLQKTGQLPADTPRVLSQVSFRLIIPCFLMSKVSRTLAFQHQGNILIIPFIGIIEIFVGAMLGKAAIRFIRKDTYLKRVNASNDPSSIEDLTAEDIKLAKNDALVIAACAFGNTVTLPLVILSGILSPKDASMANAFVALVMIGWSPFLWSYGYQMFNTAFAENTPSYVDTKISFLQICTIWFKRITNPPLYGALLGILIGGTPLAHFFFPIKGTLPGIFRKVDGSFTALYMGCSGLLQTIWEAASLLGSASVAVQSIVLACSLAPSIPLFSKKKNSYTDELDENSSNEESTSDSRLVLDTQVFWVITFIRLMAMPLVGLLLVKILHRAHLLPSNPICILTILVLSAMPTAQNLIVLLQLRSTTKPLAGALADLLVRQYALSLVSVPLWITAYSAVEFARVISNFWEKKEMYEMALVSTSYQLRIQ
ncbi:hypothetical protein SUGI_0987700 [Cryptomeria japonica]|nr:hypothetical protein SUGI_0987700 [Cryptomeria japonica]